MYLNYLKFKHYQKDTCLFFIFFFFFGFYSFPLFDKLHYFFSTQERGGGTQGTRAKHE
jgi:hypothetical protein